MNETVHREDKAADSDPVKAITRKLLAVIAILFIWYVVADRWAPWTDQARVEAYIIPLVAEVSGKVVEVKVSKDQPVEEDAVLLRIDPTDYELAVERAQTDLEQAGQDNGTETASVSTAQAKVVEAQASLDHVRAQSARVFELEKKQIYSKARGDRSRAEVIKAEARVDSARSELEKAKQALGAQGENNPKIRSAMVKLKQAQIDLSRTTVIAPSHGAITNLRIDTGHYAKQGVPVMTFIDAQDVWIKASLTENSVAHVVEGTPVDIALDSAPGRIFTGKVSSVSYAVSHEKGGTIGDLDSVENKSGWLRQSQRFPVFIYFDERPKGLLRVGGQADVQFYASDSWILNSLGWLWIRLLSWLSYIY